jgi:hypothetical protein
MERNEAQRNETKKAGSETKRNETVRSQCRNGMSRFLRITLHNETERNETKRVLDDIGMAIGLPFQKV